MWCACGCFTYVYVCVWGDTIFVWCEVGWHFYFRVMWGWVAVMNQVPRLPRKSHRQSGGGQGTPEGRQRDARAYIRPLCSAPSPAPATQKPPAERRKPRDARGTPEGRHGVHPTPLQWTKCRDARAHIQPLCMHQAQACHAKATGKAAESKGRQRDARAYIRPLCSAPSPAPATQKPPAERRRPRDARGTPEGRQGVHPTPLQCTKSRTCHAKATGRASARGTPGRTSDPFAGAPSPALATQKPPAEWRRPRDARGTPEGRQRDARAYMYVWVRCVWVCGVCDWDVWCMCSVSDVCVSDGEWVSGCLWDVCVSKWCVCVSEWCVCVWVSDECVVCVCASDDIDDVCASECVCDVCVRETCVSEDWEDRREEEKEGADTALKTKTPHVNVGKKPFISQL